MMTITILSSIFYIVSLTFMFTSFVDHMFTPDLYRIQKDHNK